MNEKRGSGEGFLKAQEYILAPGHLIFPTKKKTIYSVVTNGIVYTLFDVKKKCGGMGYYKYPKAKENEKATILFAYASISTLVGFFVKIGSKREDIVVNIYGGAERDGSSFYDKRLSKENIRMANSIFDYFGLRVGKAETGGRIGRKIAFDSGSGNHVVALVKDLRESDW
ncbi:hypothetical protein MJH12_07545 [bacterium]|nr:hypothetical protein [bacterium]